MSRFDKPGEGRLIVLSQRLHTDDLVARLRDEGGWDLLSIPAEALKPMSLDIGEDRPWTLAAGDLLFPERFDHAALRQLKSDLGDANYAAQILQDPVALGGAIFKVKDIEQIECKHLKLDKFEATYQSWDTAISEAETAAWSVCTTWGVYGKLFGLIDVFRERLSYPKLVSAVYEQRHKHQPRAVFVERASSGIALCQELETKGIKWIHPLKVRGSKLERAMHQAPKIEQRRLVIPGKAPWAETFLSELAAFPNGRSDQVDSMTQFLKVFDTGRNDPLFRELTFWRNQRP
jgi:predicted phage terminase large subunit-like protein